MITRILISDPSAIQPKRSFYLVFEGASFILNTIAFICMPLIGQLMWIVHRNEPDPYDYYIKSAVGNSWYLVAGSVAQAISMSLSDAFLVRTTGHC
jgi:hypothetical protein